MIFVVPSAVDASILFDLVVNILGVIGYGFFLDLVEFFEFDF